MATDTGIVTIYDLKNDGKPLTTHRIDAKEFLTKFPERWSTNPDKRSEAIKDAPPLKTESDDGKQMQYKGMHFKTLQVLARDKNIPNWESLEKPELVNALMALEEPEKE